MAERAGFEPARQLLAAQSLSKRARYDHFGTSPQLFLQINQFYLITRIILTFSLIFIKLFVYKFIILLQAKVQLILSIFFLQAAYYFIIFLNILAERAGFEPARQGLPVYSISSRALSAKLSHLSS